MKRLLVASFLLHLGMVVGQAQTAPAQTRIPVVFECQCDDPTGALFATAFRDLLATSPRFVEYPDALEVVNGKVRVNWVISVISVDPSTRSSGDGTALSVVVLVGGTAYITHLVQTCGRTVVKDCAASVLASLDPQLGKPAPQLLVRDMDYVAAHQ